MKAKITINEKDFEIDIGANETILESCLRAQIGPPYSCLEGVCSFCVAEVLDGEVSVIPGYEIELHPKKIKTCQSFPISKTVNLKYLKKT